MVDRFVPAFTDAAPKTNVRFSTHWGAFSRAVVVAEDAKHAAGLKMLDVVEYEVLENYQPFHAGRAHPLKELGHIFALLMDRFGGSRQTSCAALVTYVSKRRTV